MDHAGSMHFYVEPRVVEEVPRGLSAGEFVAAGDSPRTEPALDVLGVAPPALPPSPPLPPPPQLPDTPGPMPLLSAAAQFLSSSEDHTLVVLGEPGCGKSTFLWELGRGLCHPSSLPRFLDTPVGCLRPGDTAPWVPVALELKRYREGELHGLLPRVVGDARGGCLSPDSLGRLPGCGLVRLVVLCDGFDEIQQDGGYSGGGSGSDSAAGSWGKAGLAAGTSRRACLSLRDTLCGSDPLWRWAPGQLKVVVTTRENRLWGRGDEDVVFGRHRRLVLLPFSLPQMKEYITQHVAAVGSSATSESAAEAAPVSPPVDCRASTIDRVAVVAPTPSTPPSPVAGAGTASTIPSPVAEEYLAVLQQSPSLRDMVRNPFVLHLFLTALPTIRARDATLAQVTRYGSPHPPSSPVVFPYSLPTPPHPSPPLPSPPHTRVLLFAFCDHAVSSA